MNGFLAQIQDHLRMLQEYDAAISHEKRVTLEWLITNISTGSLILDTESRSTLPDKDYGLDVIEACSLAGSASNMRDAAHRIFPKKV